MTALEKMFSKDTLIRIDRFRRERGLRTRKQALELLVAETVSVEPETVEHPLFARLRSAPKARKGSVSTKMIAQIQASREAQARGERLLSLEEVRAELTQKRNRRAS
jgi:hypothetical protein